MRERGQQFRATSRTPALDGAGGHFEDVGSFFDAVTEHVDEGQGDALIVGQALEGIAYDDPRLRAGRVIVCTATAHVLLVGHDVEGLALGRGSRPHFAAPQPVVAGVDDDPVHPRAHLGLAPEPSGGAEGGQESVLEGVGGLLAVGHDAHGDSPEALTVTPHQHGEGLFVAFCVPRQKLTICELVDRLHQC